MKRSFNFTFTFAFDFLFERLSASIKEGSAPPRVTRSDEKWRNERQEIAFQIERERNIERSYLKVGSFPGDRFNW